MTGWRSDSSDQVSAAASPCCTESQVGSHVREFLLRICVLLQLTYSAQTFEEVRFSIISSSQGWLAHSKYTEPNRAVWSSWWLGCFLPRVMKARQIVSPPMFKEQSEDTLTASAIPTETTHMPASRPAHPQAYSLPHHFTG